MLESPRMTAPKNSSVSRIIASRLVVVKVSEIDLDQD